MRIPFDNAAARGWAHPANPTRVRSRTWLAVIFVLLILALSGETLIAAVYEGFSNLDARGVMDQPW